MQEMEISIKDLAKKILQQWRLLLISMIVCAILATVVGGVFSLKNIVVGIALGVVAIVGYVAVTYVFSRKLRSVSDMAQGFSISIIGVLPWNKENKKKMFEAVDRVIEKVFYEGRMIPEKVNVQIIGADIYLSAKKQKMENLCFTGNVPKEVVMSVVKSVKAEKGEQKVNVHFDELAIYSSDALKNMLNADGVVLFEQIGKSTFVDIKKELKYCERYNIPVLGCVIIE